MSSDSISALITIIRRFSREMDEAGAFTDVELDDASLDALLGSGAAIGQCHKAGC